MNDMWPEGYIGHAGQSNLYMSWDMLERLKKYV